MFDHGFPSDWSTIKKLIWLKASILSGASYIIKTVTGTLPLTLTNAVAHAVSSLTQYGRTQTPDMSSNLITGWVDGYYINASGVPTSGAGNQYTDLVPVDTDKTYVLSLISGVEENKRMHEYDSSGNWLRQCFAIKPAANTSVNQTFTVGTGTEYVRWSCRTVDLNVAIKQVYSTPTPSDPVPICCNNGEMVYRDTELPTAYRRIRSMTMNNDCYYIVEGFKLTGADTLRFAFSTGTTACNVLGAYSGSASGNNYSLYCGNASSAAYLRYKNKAYNSQALADTRYDVAISPTGSSGMENDSTWDQLDFTCTTDFCIGTTATSTSSAKMVGTFYGNVEVEDSNGLRFKGIPCVRVSDSEVGWYDTVSETFFEPVGATPTAGNYDYSHHAVVVDGTPEVLTVGSKNLFNKNAPNKQDGYLASQGLNKTTRLESAAEGQIVYVMPCRPLTRYCISKIATDRLRCATFVDFPTPMVSGQWATGSKLLKNAGNGSTATDDTKSAYFDTPDNANWLAFQVTGVGCTALGITEQNILDSLQVEIGVTTPSDYVPYYNQTASVVDLLSVGDVKDEQEVIGGTVTRRCAVCLYDGTQPVGNTYISSTGGKDIGAIIVYPLATPTTESVTAQPLSTVAGTNIVDATAEVSGINADVTYFGSA